MLSTDFHAYGIHSQVPYRRSDELPYGIFKVLGGGTFGLSGEFEDLFGGSSRYAWASELKTITSEFTSTVKSLPDFLFELFLGAKIDKTPASATGTVGALKAIKGNSLSETTTGIASATLKTGESGNLKTGRYLIAATAASKVNVYAMTDIEFGRGNPLSYVDDSLKITKTELTIATTVKVEIPNTGIELTGGSTATALVEGDTAEFAVTAPHGGISEIAVGQSSAIFPEHGNFLLAARRNNGDMLEIQIHKASGGGLPIPLEETVFSIPELTTKVLYDSSVDRVATFRKVRGVAA